MRISFVILVYFVVRVSPWISESYIVLVSNPWK
jgi:hypothetical protein